MRNTRFMMRVVNILVLGALLVCLVPAQAQNFMEQNSYTAFQSTSTMEGSGSAYSSNPTLDENGTASAPASAPAGGPRRIGGLPGSSDLPDTSKDGDNTPIGDAMLPLMLMAAAFGGVVHMRRRKASV